MMSMITFNNAIQQNIIYHVSSEAGIILKKLVYRVDPILHNYFDCFGR